MLKKVLRYILPFWRGLAAIITFTIFQSLISSFIPYLSKPLIDSGYANKDVKTVIGLAIIGGAMFIATTLLNFVQRYHAENAKKVLLLKLGEDYSRSLYSLSLDGFRVKGAGERAYLLNVDLDSIANFLVSRLPQIFGILFKAVLYLGITFGLNKGFSLTLFLLTPPLVLMSRFFGRINRDNYIELMRLSQKMSQRIYESFSKIYLVKAFGAEEYEKKRYMESLKERLAISLRSLRFNFLGSFAGSIFNKSAIGMVSVFGIFLVIKKSMTLGDLSAFLVYYGLFLGMINQISDFFTNLPIDTVHLKNFFDLIESKRKIEDSPGAIYMPHLKGSIVFRDASFGYAKDRKVLNGFNLHVEPGVWTAIIGPSGCGKTTVLNLIMRLYDVDKGEVLIDGMNLKGLKIRSLRKNITMASQDVLFFTDTVKNNVLYGIEAAERDEADLAKMLEVACINDFIAELPLKYDTVLGDNAFNISQGQKQRLAVARALARRPNILILDEALSSVSVEVEAKIYGDIKNFRKNLTTIIVSHRPSTIGQADLIYRMDFGGRVEEVLKSELGKQEPAILFPE